jgi:hypothetical protein
MKWHYFIHPLALFMPQQKQTVMLERFHLVIVREVERQGRVDSATVRRLRFRADGSRQRDQKGTQ